MTSEIEFTDDEIREELARLGYQNVPADKLVEFKKDLMKLINSDRSKNTSMNSSGDEQISPEGKESSGFVTENFTNHGSQWIGNNGFREDWHYRGKNSSAPDQDPRVPRNDVQIPGSYALYELPVSSQYEQDDNNCRDDVSLADSEHRFLKRKTVRKTTDGGRRVDESMSDSDTAGIFEIYEKIKNMAMRDCECDKSRPKSADTEPPYRMKGKNRTPSVIVSKKEPPHTRNLVRCRPMERMKMYEKLWKKQPAVGEDSRDDLRQMVHSKLLKREDVQLEKKVYIANTYVVPTTKQRMSLRWQVRSAMENYELPPHGVYHDI